MSKTTWLSRDGELTCDEMVNMQWAKSRAQILKTILTQVRSRIKADNDTIIMWLENGVQLKCFQ